jgi:hypothetical protein
MQMQMQLYASPHAHKRTPSRSLIGFEFDLSQMVWPYGPHSPTHRGVATENQRIAQYHRALWISLWISLWITFPLAFQKKAAHNRAHDYATKYVVMSNEGALANLDVDAAIERIASGVLSKTIAAEYGVTPFGLRSKLALHPDYKQAVADQASTFVEDAVAEVMSSGEDGLPLDALAIARARVRVDTAFKYAKAHNKDYADKQQVELSLPKGPVFSINLVAQTPMVQCDSVIEHDLGQDGDK